MSDWHWKREKYLHYDKSDDGADPMVFFFFFLLKLGNRIKHGGRFNIYHRNSKPIFMWYPFNLFIFDCQFRCHKMILIDRNRCSLPNVQQ